ncbi:tripartite tricarboxylate transporter TctB family protein [Rhizobium sp. FY34]|uniref:tripartite tricarboxylate transporter TctB family protein n=1 Tax=Rhizobium sp. FY34 TaxID=2562309 RepID=UPI0010C0718D|nr:tripartite tricarboxylate transporter TctB family protein [Rhizobium sp. FY34]
MRIQNERDFFSGAGLTSIAAIMWYQVSALSLTQGTSLGSGGLPKLSAIILALYGLYFVFRGITKSGERIGKLPYVGMAALAASVAVFALGLEPLGAAISGVLAAGLAGFAAPDRRFKELMIFPLIVCAGCLLLFVYFLGIPLPIWPST